MKKLFLFAAAAALLAACSSKDDLSTGQQPQQPVATDDGAVSFEAYTGRAATRGGVPGVLTTSTASDPKISMETTGFGVFGYYTDNNDYDQRATPNFFYNQKVEGAGWTYKPVKYWPNEYGTNATSEDADKVTFFAYAPWVDVVPTSGKLVGADTNKDLEQWGITGMTRNSTQGDPILKYIASFRQDKSVDLCWGVADAGDGVWLTTQPDKTVNIADGEPWINVYRPASYNQKVKFTFKHATAQMRINIDAVIDRDDNTPGGSLGNKTRVWVREVKFNGFAMKGSLNLNNDDDANTPKWLDYNGQNELVSEAVTVYDGRKDGKEGVAGAIATNEKTLGLNPTLVQDGIYAPVSGDDVYDNTKDLVVQGVPTTDETGVTGNPANCKREGVTSTTVSLFAQNGKNENVGTTNNYFYVIPTDEAFEIEIVYDIETVSENLAQNLSDGQTKGSSIENRIRKTVKFGDAEKLQPGRSYKLNLHLGMYSVKFDADVTDWETEPAEDVDLPLNVPAFAQPVNPTDAGHSEASAHAVTIPYTGSFTFALTGLDGGESVSAASIETGKGLAQTKSHATDATETTELTGWSGAAGAAWSNGYALLTLATSTNPTTSNRQQLVKWTSGQSNKDTYFLFTQQAHPLGLSGSATPGTKTITLTRSGISGAYGWFCKGLSEKCVKLTGNGDPEAATPTHGIAVYRNGIKLNWEAESGDPINGNGYTFGDEAPTITLYNKLVSGDRITIVLKTGDAPIETINFTI